MSTNESRCSPQVQPSTGMEYRYRCLSYLTPDAGVQLRHADERDQVYYFNTLTNESRWDPPPGWSEDMAAKVDKEP
eukprot:scaffold241609_cov22-Tisochrysis_lutea.AAC.1